MEINEELCPIEVGWEGAFVEDGDRRRGELPKVSLGKPVWWPASQILGPDWIAPAGRHGYGLARFCFSLRPPSHQEVKRLDFVAELHPDARHSAPTFFDLYPVMKTVEESGELKVGVGPELKFAGLEASVAKIAAKINLRHTFPVVVASGIGERTACWGFEARATHPLVGSQCVFAIVELPAPAPKTVRVSLRLEAQIDTHFGPVHGLLPETEKEHLSWRLV